MSREIKFRIWDNLKKEWLINKQVFRINIGGDRTGNLIKNHEFFFKQHPEGHTIQQYIGLKDKTGREIYEGDIVNFVIPGITHGPEREEIKNHVVKWDEEYACWCFDNGKNYNYSIPGDRIDTESFEIIGNIFENPELLKKYE